MFGRVSFLPPFTICKDFANMLIKPKQPSPKGSQLGRNFFPTGPENFSNGGRNFSQLMGCTANREATSDVKVSHFDIHLLTLGLKILFIRIHIQTPILGFPFSELYQSCVLCHWIFHPPMQSDEQRYLAYLHFSKNRLHVDIKYTILFSTRQTDLLESQVFKLHITLPLYN